ncbi:DUF1205 domain-containing protein [Streptomyces sp. DSM 44915]|uniref:DUF1205 domain-containing protein n=1 Tax=Streptomyces chisholmiae TaxID=3075540 RepID=A0ABU2JSV3_9ACTN|nr:nucleotide disphospho-sugar-binding domain-containing protein [Streptomyces sp. DSM 44915]MDT0268066.1 DUF1205 domain-containing protein [Streptomyces sp. DSM 44915]
MRILLAIFDADTHFYNTVNLAWAFRAAGHEVYVAGPPQMERHVVASGLPHVPIGLEQDMMADVRTYPYDQLAHGTKWDIREEDPEVLNAEFARRALGVWYSDYSLGYMGHEEAVRDIADFARSWKPDVVLWDTISLVGQVASQVANALSVRILFGRDQFVRMANVIADAGEWDDYDNPMSKLLTKRLELVGEEYDPRLMFGDVTIDSNPSFSYDAWDLRRQRMRYLPYNGPSVVPDWLKVPAERPRVAFTIGLSLRQVDDDRFTLVSATVKLPELMEALGEVDAEVVATLDEDQITRVATIPDNVRIVGFVPLAPLLTTCSAIVHHGGAGTRNNAFVRGVPQVISPSWAWDEDFVARNAQRLGAGIMVDPDNLKPADVRDSVNRILSDDSFAKNAAVIQEEMLSYPTPAEVVRNLEEMVVEHRDTRG